RNFIQARKHIQYLDINSVAEWETYCKSGTKPMDIPYSPHKVYKSEWKGWADWLGTGVTNPIKWPVQKVKELLRDLIKSKVIYQWDEAVLYSFLLRKGLLSLRVRDNRHSDFFKNLINASRTEVGQKMIEDYAKSDSDTPPDLSSVTTKVPDILNEIQTISTSELQ